jgi:hypothetical protein
LIGDDSQRFMEKLRFASMFARLERQTCGNIKQINKHRELVVVV